MSIDIMKYFIGKVIKVDRGGPESRIGKLLEACDDHLVLLTEDDGVVYYKTQHIKSFTDYMKGQAEFNINVPKDLKYKQADNFQNLLDSLKFQWVSINRGGPEKLEGVLSDVHEDYVSLINKEEIVRLAMFHIRSISYGLKIEKAEDANSNNQSNKQADYQSKQSEKQQSRQQVVKSSSKEQQSRQQIVQSSSKEQQSRQQIVQSSDITEEVWDNTEEVWDNTEEVWDNTEEVWDNTEVEDVNLTDLLSSMEKFLRKYSKTNQN